MCACVVVAMTYGVAGEKLEFDEASVAGVTLAKAKGAELPALPVCVRVHV